MTKTGFKKLTIFSLIFLVFIPVVSLKIELSNPIANYQNGLNNLKTANIVPEIDLSQLPEIDYETLNTTWYDQKIEMLIIINDTSFLDAVTPLMEWKNEKGVKTIILSNYSDYEGRDKAEQIRNMIKEYYEKENIQWVLLAGDAEENLIPIRQVYNPDVTLVGSQSEYLKWDDNYKPTDFYYADLTGSWDDNNNSIWGESSEYTGNIDEISWIPEVYVGRLPAGNIVELSNMINKTLKYETDPFMGDWMNKMLLAGGVSSSTPPEDEARLTEYIWQNYTVSEMNFTHLIKKTNNFTPTTPPSPNNQSVLNQVNFRSELNSGYSTIIFAGHADPTRFTDADGTSFYTNIDALSSSNINMPSLLYADACTTSSYDKNDNSIGELLIKRPLAGAVGYIGAIRVSWYFDYDENLEKLNRGNAKLFWKEFFDEKKFQQGRALYDSKVTYMNSDYFKRGDASMVQEWQRKNILTYNLLGDPELDIYTNIPRSVPNLFTENFYEGQLVSLQVKDNLGGIVPGARINLRTSDGKYRTIYTDINGFVDFRLPVGANENYSIIITGHNIVPSYHNFTTLLDTDIPLISDVIHAPINPTVSDNLLFSINANDIHSGIESVFLLISKNNFTDFSTHRLSNHLNENKREFNITLNKMEPGKYSYIVIARDFSNKTTVYYEDKFNFAILKPFTDYVLVIASIMIVGLAGISSSLKLFGIRRYKNDLRKLE